ncbi:hypothetical protein U5903_04325 [Cereibacter johrii]|uniref:hypothetical protein n=1 Tax=Cereibacter johrii TaxID=445629 RepID=UPI002B2639F6|nr:hypothetical protein [Cereibacter johrii]MEA5159995.1 hypothetical protein [Cereibacter johrii]
MGMTGKEFEEKCQQLVGTAEHGWKKRVARDLDISQPTLRAALEKGPSVALETKLLSIIARVQVMKPDEVLTTEAGKWIIGEPETRKASDLTLAEVVVTHMSTPSFMLHAEAAKGDGGKASMLYRVRWIDDQSKVDPHQQAAYIEKAKARAQKRIYEVLAVQAEVRGREHAARKARDAGSPLTKGLLEALPALKLAVEKRGLTAEHVKAAMAELDAAKAREWAKRDAMSVGEARAFDAGKRCGEYHDASKVAFLALIAIEGAAPSEELLARHALVHGLKSDVWLRSSAFAEVAHHELSRGDKPARDAETADRLRRSREAKLGVELHGEDMKDSMAILRGYSEGRISRRDALIRSGLLTPAELSAALRAAGLPEPRQAT